MLRTSSVALTSGVGWDVCSLACNATICLPMLGAMTAYTPLASVTAMRASLGMAYRESRGRDGPGQLRKHTHTMLKMGCCGLALCCTWYAFFLQVFCFKFCFVRRRADPHYALPIQGTAAAATAAAVELHCCSLTAPTCTPRTDHVQIIIYLSDMSTVHGLGPHLPLSEIVQDLHSTDRSNPGIMRSIMQNIRLPPGKTS